MIRVVQGGKALGGFLSGFAGSLFGGFAKDLDNVDTITKTIMVAVAGGTASMLGGGKFANGAMSAAFVFMFNEYGQRGRFKGEEHHNGQSYMANGTRVSADGKFLYVDGSPYAIHQDTNVGAYILMGGAAVAVVGLSSVYGGAVYLYVLANPEIPIVGTTIIDRLNNLINPSLLPTTPEGQIWFMWDHYDREPH